MTPPYAPVTGILVLCTANVCRSPMAQALLSGHLAGQGVTVTVRSAGMLAAGEPVPPEVIAAAAGLGADVSGHRSRTASTADLAGADLVVAMAREHVRFAVVRCPAAWPRTFTLRELVRRGHEVGPRSSGEPLAAWLGRAAHGRDHRDLLGDSAGDDVADPIGGPPQAYEATAVLLDQLTADLVELCWGFSPGA